MFERFTRDAREVVHGAVTLAATLGQSHVGPEHFAAALPPAGGRAADLLAAHHVDAAALEAAAGGGQSAVLSDDEIEALRSVGVDAAEVLRRIEQEFGPQPVEPRPGGRRRRRPLRRESIKVLQQSLRQAQDLRHRQLGTEHILLALLAQDDPDPATRLIQSHGLTYDTARTALAA